MRKNLLVFLAWLEFREPEGGVVGDKGAGDEVSINMLVGPPFVVVVVVTLHSAWQPTLVVFGHLRYVQ